jgi:hypothetical protein
VRGRHAFGIGACPVRRIRVSPAII